MEIIFASTEAVKAVHEIHQHMKANKLPKDGNCKANALLVITKTTYERYSADLSYDMKLEFLELCNSSNKGRIFDVQ